MKKSVFVIVLGALFMCSCTCLSSKQGVYFKNLKDGDVVSSPVTVEMGVRGIEVKPAGMLAEGSGHHHIIIDKGGIENGAVVPADEKHIHFGKGQTETELKLSKGKHTLTLQFANGIHQSYGKTLSKTITITVE